MRCLLLSFILALSASAQETMIREVFDPLTDTHVEVLALFSKPARSGYFPVRVKIANNLKNERRVYLDFKSQSNYTDDLLTSSSFAFAAQGGKTVIADILVPLCPPRDGYGDQSITVKMSGSMGEATNSINGGQHEKQPAVLLSEALFTPNASTLDSAVKKSGSSSGRSGEFAAKFDPKQLPDEWLAFSGYDSILMTDRDWADIPPGARNAILSWLRLGGQLVIYSSSSATLETLGLPAQASFGTVTLRSIPSDLSMNAAEVVSLVAKNKTQPQHVSSRENFMSTWPLQQAFGSQTFRYSLFVAVLVIFAILVGPVNLFVFAKSGQRHRLFITTPLISLAASLILIVLIIVQDGFGGNGLRRVLMEVRPESGINAAYIHQEQFSRTGVLTNSNFTLDTPATFQPVPIADSRWARYSRGSSRYRSDNGEKGTFNLQPDDGKIKASGDWFQSRSEQGHILSAVTSTRGRIEKTDTPDSFISTFEFPIETLYYLDEASQWHRAEAVTAGKRFKLSPIDGTMAARALATEVNAFAARNREFLKTAAKRKGHFIAITPQAPGIATNPGIRWKETRTIITGPVVSP
jgi:hypothetical protein